MREYTLTTLFSLEYKDWTAFCKIIQEGDRTECLLVFQDPDGCGYNRPKSIDTPLSDILKEMRSELVENSLIYE